MDERGLSAIDLYAVDLVDQGAGEGVFHTKKDTNLLHVILRMVTICGAVRSLETGELEISLQHPLPPGPVVPGVVTPYIELAGDVLVAEDLRHAFVCVPALVVHAGREDVFVVPVAVEIPGIAGVRQVVHGDVEVAVVVVVAGEEAGGVEGATHGEQRGEVFGMT